MWRTPVIDRTLTDSEYLIALNNSISNIGWDLTSESDKYYWKFGDSLNLLTSDNLILNTSLAEPLIIGSGTIKGAWNVTDGNRIIDNSVYLRDALNANGYPVWFEQQEYYTQETLQYYSTLNTTMKANIHALVNAFYSLNNPYINDTNVPRYVGANAMEENLRITKMLLDNMISEYVYSGTSTTGETVVL